MNDAAPSMEMLRYQSKKRALEVASVNDDNVVTFADKRYAPRKMEADVFARYRPVAGDFLMLHGDGSWSVNAGLR